MTMFERSFSFSHFSRLNPYPYERHGAIFPLGTARRLGEQTQDRERAVRHEARHVASFLEWAPYRATQGQRILLFVERQFSGLDALLANGGLPFLTSGNNDSPANPSTFPHWLFESSGKIDEERQAEPIRARASQLPSLKEMSSAVNDQNRPAPPPPSHNSDVASARNPSRSCRDGCGNDDSALGRRAKHARNDDSSSLFSLLSHMSSLDMNS
jgi:hypothetical protein